MRQFMIQILVITAVGMVLAVVFGQILLGGPTAQPVSDAGDVHWYCYEERLKVTSSVPIRGWGHLCVGERSVKMVVDASDLNAGEVYTTWLAYIDDPSTCSATPCTLLEFSRPEHRAQLNRLDVTVADATRQATFTCTLRGLTPAPGAQVQLLLVAHGAAVYGERRAHQILGARWPERNWDQATGEGVVARAHFSMRHPQD
jgi:hypothetical protein